MASPERDAVPTRQHGDDADPEVAALRRQLWSARDACIGAQAEAAALKVENRELEVRIGQLSQALAEQRTFERIVGRIRRDPRVRMLGTKLREVVGGSG